MASESERAIERVVEDLHLQFTLKEEQKEAILRLTQNQNVFCILPTGYGKSAIYALFPKVMDELHRDEDKHIALVISPLKSLMEDQVNSWNAIGISSAAIQRFSDMQQADVQGILEGSFSLVFSSPEAILLDPWWGMVKRHRKRICLLALDEVHCLTKWGESFRPDYKLVSRTRALLTKTAVLALTATATQSMVPEILENLHLRQMDTHLVGVLPDRPNIFLSIEKVTDDVLFHLNWYVEILKKEGCKAPRAIIYTRTIDKVTSIYGLLVTALGERAWVGDEKTIDSRIVEMYHAQTDDESKQRIVKSFPCVDSPLRCVIATVAFGMGIQVPDIRYVLHWGPSKDVLAYWQEVGRCSRDGHIGKALMYIFPRSMDKRFIKDDIKNIIDNSLTGGQCMRKAVLNFLMVRGMKVVEQDKGECCCTCLKSKCLSHT